MDNDTNNHNHIQSQAQKTGLGARRRGRRRTWDSVVVGIAFSLAFVLLITKVAHTTPCEVLIHLNIDTKTCIIVSDSSTVMGQLANQHGLGFSIIIQYALLASELAGGTMSHVQQFLQNI